MKKNGILNGDIPCVLSRMGHTDTLCVGDCGLPIPDGPERIDLAVKFGLPSFLDVLYAVGSDMKAEKITLAEEMKEKNPELLEKVLAYFQDNGNPEVEFVSHEELKRKSASAKAVIRTGEATPYANIILQSGCIF